MVSPPPVSPKSFEDAYKEYRSYLQVCVEDGSIQSRTAANYLSDVGLLKKYLPDPEILMDEVSGQDIELVIEKYKVAPDKRFTTNVEEGRETQKSLGTLVRFYRSLSNFFTYAQKRHWVALSPMGFVSAPVLSAEPLADHKMPLSLSELSPFLKYGPGVDGEKPHEKNSDRDRALLLVLLACGVTVSELIRSDDQDFVFTESGQWVWSVRGRNGAVREIMVPADVAQMVKVYRRVRPDVPTGEVAGKGPLFRTGRGNRLCARDVNTILSRAALRARQGSARFNREVTPHSLRHTCAVMLVGLGWDLTHVAAFLGLSGVGSLQRYVEVDADELRRAGEFYGVLAQKSGG